MYSFEQGNRLFDGLVIARVLNNAIDHTHATHARRNITGFIRPQKREPKLPCVTQRASGHATVEQSPASC